MTWFYFASGSSGLRKSNWSHFTSSFISVSTKHKGWHGRFGILLRLALQDGEDGVDDGYGIPLLALWQTSLLILLLLWVHWDFGTGVYGCYEDMDGIVYYYFSFVFLEGKGLARCTHARVTYPYMLYLPGLERRGCTAPKASHRPGKSTWMVLILKNGLRDGSG